MKICWILRSQYVYKNCRNNIATQRGNPESFDQRLSSMLGYKELKCAWSFQLLPTYYSNIDWKFIMWSQFPIFIRHHNQFNFYFSQHLYSNFKVSKNKLSLIPNKFEVDDMNPFLPLCTTHYYINSKIKTIYILNNHNYPC